MARRRRGLTPEDRRIWEQVTRTTTPLAPKVPAAAEAPLPDPPLLPLPADPATPPVVADPRQRGPRPAPPFARVELSPDPHAWLERAVPHMDRRRFDTLRRGRMEPEARLDLHGMTADVAHQALTRFVLGAHASGFRLVLVITGKGKAGAESGHWPERRGILRYSVPHWLAAPPLSGRILQVAVAHDKHGGGGALYVYLRRQR